MPSTSQSPLIPAASTLLRLLQHRALHQPDVVGYRFLGDTSEPVLTYEALKRRVYAIAAALQALQARGTPVLLLYPPGLEFVTAFWGCLVAGAIAVPLPPPSSAHSLERIRAVVANAGASIALGTTLTQAMYERRAARYEALRPLQWVNTETLLPETGDAYQPPLLSSDTLAYLQYTSGSTGTPKGVKIQHAQLLHNATGVAEHWHVTPDTVQVQWMPTFHDLGLITGVVVPLLTGTPVTLLSPLSVLLHPIGWLRAISQLGATFSGGPNFALEQCIRETTPQEREGLDLRSWRVAYTGGEFVHAATLERFSRAFEPYGFQPNAFYAGYGLAESTLLVTTSVPRPTGPRLLSVDKNALERNHVTPESTLDEVALVGCGVPITGLEVAIVNPATREPLHANEIGEIWVSGPSIAEGYWKVASERQETFNARLSTGEGPFLRTGDLGFLNEGELFVTGRLKDLLIIRGRNLYPHDIEATTADSHPALLPVAGAVFSISVGTEERVVVVQEVARDEKAFEAIAVAIRQAISEKHEVKPEVVVLIRAGTLPKTSSGKIARGPCRVAFLQGTLDILYEWRNAPSLTETPPSFATTPHPSIREIADWLVEYLARALGVPSHTIVQDRPFTSLGLDSADTMRLVHALELWVGRALSPTLFWNYPTVQDLARHLGADAPVTDAALSVGPVVRSDGEPIAVIGIGCRFPGARDPDEFWALLRDGIHAVGDVPPERWDAQFFYDPTASVPGKMVTRQGAFLKDVAHFDATFFGISPREATTMDPQQRLVLEVAWEALEYAGLAPAPLAGSQTGVFIGVSASDYYQLQVQTTAPEALDRYAGTGSALTITANRLSYLLDLRGPSMAVDTACSSSLVAIHLGCQSLAAGESTMVIAGGVNLILMPESSVVFSQLNVLAPDGQCKTFDESANGYGRGEGCGIVILKRLSDALTDGDSILALIHGTAVNQDGRSNGLTAPNGMAQQAVIHTALDRAGMTSSDLSYIEAHGTGTALGDPIEVEALAQVLASAPGDTTCWLGSVKTNIGHLEPAAGVAGLLKVILALQHGEIPPHLHFQHLNPHIDLTGTRLAIPTERTPWPRTRVPRIAGVSAFALGGTNAHIIVGEAPSVSPAPEDASPQVLVLSAKSQTALDQQSLQLAAFLKKHSSLCLADVAYTLQTGRATFHHRRALVCQTLDEAILALQRPVPPALYAPTTERTHPPGGETIFLFPGQGKQYLNMGRGLYKTQRVFRDMVDQCAMLLMPELQLDLRDILYPVAEPPARTQTLLNQTWLTQPALFVVEYALLHWWHSLGIKPTAMIGHSLGEYVAACAAGVLSLPDALALVAARGRMMQALPQGAMLAVPLADSDIEPYLTADVSLAAINGSHHCVVAGPTDAVLTLQNALAQQDIAARLLETSHAFHSAMMTPIMDRFAETVAKYPLHPPRIAYVSNLTGTWITAAEATNPDYYARHLRYPVRFEAGIRQLLATPESLFLEVGPGRTLGRLVQHHPDCASHHRVLFSVREAHDPQPDEVVAFNTLGHLWQTGRDVIWSDWQANERRHRVALPTYPFERQHYWIDGGARPHSAPAQPAATPEPPPFYIATPTWEPAPLEPLPLSAAPQRWLVFAGADDFSLQLVQRLRKTQPAVVTVVVGDRFARIASDTYSLCPTQRDQYDALLSGLRADRWVPDQVVYLWGIAVDTSMLEDIQQREVALSRTFYGPLFLAQGLGSHIDSPAVQFTILTHQMQSGLGTGPISAAQALLLGPTKVMAQEYPQLRSRSIDVRVPRGDSAAFEALLGGVVLDLMSLSAAPVVAYRDRTRWVQTLTPVVSQPVSSLQLRECGVYLITGGTGGVGLALAEVLAQDVRARLVLVSRTAVPADAEWNAWLATHPPQDRTSRLLRAVQGLEAKGAEVWLARADVTSAVQMHALVTEVHQKWGQIHGIIHAAGVAGAGMIQTKSPALANAVLAPKVWGALVLARVLNEMSLDFVLLCSSLSALVGGVGQVDYCAANAFLDGFAHEWQATTPTKIVSLNWDLWQGVGMALPTRGYPRGDKHGHPLLGHPVLEQGDHTTFATTLGETALWVLDEHRIFSNQPTMPSTGYLELIHAAVARGAKVDTFHMHDVAFVAPLVIPEGETREIRTQLERHGTLYDVKVMSRAPGHGAPWVTHTIAEIDTTVPRAPSPFDLAAWRAHQQVHQTAEPTLLALDRYGPRWQNVTCLGTGTDDFLIELSLPAEFGADLNDFALHPALLDVATAFVSKTVSGRYLPFWYKRVTVFRPLHHHCYSHVRRLDSETTPELLVFDVVVLDPEGTVLVAIEGFTMKKVAVQANGDIAIPAPSEAAVRLVTTEPGLLTNLSLQPVARRSPGADEVEIEVYSAGLNFKDVLSAYGLFDEPLGIECAGSVVAVGTGVADISVGMDVVALAPACFATFTTTKAALVAQKPPMLTFEAAATLPMAFVTAYQALIRLAHLQRGERILIHAASGGVGLAAVQIAKQVGAEIFATAGNPDKREFLASLGIPHVMDSRTLAFTSEILERTNGAGVDVVLNSLAGEFLAQSLAVLAPYGRFLELGKQDILQNHPLALRPFDRNLSFFAIDIGRMLQERTAVIEGIFREVMQQVRGGDFAPLPYQTFALHEAHHAFELMSRARHIGKVVLVPTPHGRPSVPVAATRVTTGLTREAGQRAFRKILSMPLDRPQLIVASVPPATLLLPPVPLTDTPAPVVPHKYPRPSLTTSYVAGRTPTEQRIATIWEQVLAIEPIGIYDNFFELGGDSLLGVQALTLLKRDFQVDLAATSLYQSPTVSAMAKLISGDPASGEGLEERQQRGAKRRTAIQQRHRSKGEE